MREDILLDVTGDLAVLNGDFVIGDANQQNVELILKTSPGEWKRNPTVGAGLVNSYQGSVTGFVKRNVTVQLEADGYGVNELTVNENGINVSTTTL
jgi:hypothetical protein